MRYLVILAFLLTSCSVADEPKEEEPPKQVEILRMMNDVECTHQDGRVIHIYKGQMATGNPQTREIQYVDNVTGEEMTLVDDGAWDCVVQPDGV